MQKKPQKKQKEKLTDEPALLENYTTNHILKSLGKAATTYKIRKYKEGTYLNCDLRYFNLASLGKFDVVLIDPPWRISGAQRHGEGSNMFSNSKKKMKYLIFYTQ